MEISKSSLYEKLEDYYFNNAYEEVLEFSHYDDVSTTNVHYHRKDGQRNPVHRAIEFYTNKVIPGEMTGIKISTDNQSLIDAIYQVLNWSNFSANKQRDIRHLSLHGNLFWKANTDGKKVWFDQIDSKLVTSFKTDTRGYITEIRIDTPVKGERGESLNRVEYWSKPEGYYAIWISYSNSSTPLEQLGTPTDSGFLEEIGVGNMIPIVHVKFIDAGYQEGISAVYHVLSKIEEANRQARRLHEILFRFGKPITAISSNAEDKSGAPIAPPLLDEGETINNGDTDIIYLPGKATASSLIPAIDYQAALNILNAQLDEIVKDLPEVKYYELAESQLSARAIKLQMGGAVAKAEECRGNFIAGLIRIIQISLTLGSFWNIFNVGTYENGDFEFSFLLPEMFPMDESEKAILLKDLTVAGLPLASALQIAGYDDEFIAKVIADKQAETSQTTQNNLNAFNNL